MSKAISFLLTETARRGMRRKKINKLGYYKAFCVRRKQKKNFSNKANRVIAGSNHTGHLTGFLRPDFTKNLHVNFKIIKQSD